MILSFYFSSCSKPTVARSRGWQHGSIDKAVECSVPRRGGVGLPFRKAAGGYAQDENTHPAQWSLSLPFGDSRFSKNFAGAFLHRGKRNNLPGTTITQGDYMTPTTIFLIIATRYLGAVTKLLRAMIDLRKQIHQERRDSDRT